MGSEQLQNVNVNRGHEPTCGRAALLRSPDIWAERQLGPTNGRSMGSMASAVPLPGTCVQAFAAGWRAEHQSFMSRQQTRAELRRFKLEWAMGRNPCIPKLLVAALEGCAPRGRRSFWSAGALSRFGGPRRARRPRTLHAQPRAKEKRRRGGRTPKPDGTSAPRGDRCGVLGCGSPTPLRGVVVYQQLRDAPELRKPRNSSNSTTNEHQWTRMIPSGDRLGH